MNDVLIHTIIEHTKVMFYNFSITLKTCDMDTILCDMPIWKHVYHTLHSLDQWYINPEVYTEPNFHEPNLNSLDIYDNKKVLYVFSMGSDEIKSKSHDELYMKSIQKIMPGDIENGITFISIDEIENIGEEYSLIIFVDITMFSKSTIKDIRDAIEKVYWKVNKIIIYSCERVFPIGENMDLVDLLNPMPMIEPRFLNTRIKLEDDIPLAVYEYVKWFSYNNKNVIIMVPDEEKLSKVYYTYKNNLKDNNAKVVKYEKGDDFKNIKNIVDIYKRDKYENVRRN